MQIVMFAGGGGSGGLKNYIKGYLQNAEVDSSIKIFFICTPELASTLDSVSENVSIIPDKSASRSIWDVVFNRPLNKRIIRLIEKINPDLVYFLTGIIPRSFKWKRIAIEMHNQLYINDRTLRKQGFSKTSIMLYANRRLVRKSIKKADITIFDSQQSLQQAISNDIMPRKSLFSYFGVVDEERVENLSKTYSLHTPIKFIYVSTLFPYKNQIPLLSGLKLLKDRGYDFHLDLVGSGPVKDTQKIKKHISNLGLDENVIIHGWVNHDEIKKMIDESDIFLYASSIETSGFGLMEGMVRGATIACHSESCMPEILNEGGCLFNVYSPESTADCIENLIKDEDLRRKVSSRAFEISRLYTWENHNMKIFNALKEDSKI